MNNCSKILLTIGLAVSLHMGLYPTTDIAMSAVAPTVTNQPAITAGISTPVRLAADSAGNTYVTDPQSGVLKYNSAGSLVLRIVTSKSGGGVAIAQDGTPNARLLVAQGAYVAVINPANGVEESRFWPLAGQFKYANAIAVDGSNNIYVSDSRDNKVYKFNSTYVQQTPIITITNGRPSGIAIDLTPNNNRLAIANSIAGTIQFYNPATMTLLEPVGSRNINDQAYIPPTYPSAPEFSYPQGIAFEYTYNTATPPVITGVKRIYVAETFQANVQVLDGVFPYNRIADIGGYGFVNGKLFAPSDVLIDQKNPLNTRLLVANGGGNLSVFGVDSNKVYFNLSLTTIGTGSITGTGPENGNISVPENTSNAQYTILSGATVNLTATPSANSIFAGWTGACTGTNVNCTFPMNADNTATATFTAQQMPFFVNGLYYDNLQSAYNAAPNGSVIMIMNGTWPGSNTASSFTADQAKTVTLAGGYDSQFTAPGNGNTIITGRINVKAGKVIMNNIRTK